MNSGCILASWEFPKFGSYITKSTDVNEIINSLKIKGKYFNVTRTSVHKPIEEKGSEH